MNMILELIIWEGLIEKQDSICSITSPSEEKTTDGHGALPHIVV